MEEQPPAKKPKPDEDGVDKDKIALGLIFQAQEFLLWGNPQRAIELFNESFGYSELPVAYYGRGLAKFLLGDASESFADIQTAIDTAENKPARLFWASEKIVMCNAVGNFQESRRLVRSYPFPDDPKMGYLKLKSLVCSEDVSWDEVRQTARVFFEHYSQLEEAYKDFYTDELSRANKLLLKYSLRLNEVEKTEVEDLIKNVLLQNITSLLDVHLVQHEDQFFLDSPIVEIQLRRYLCELACLELEKTDRDFHRVATRVRMITFQDTATWPPDFLEMVLQMPLKKTSDEGETQTPPQERTAEEIHGFIQQTIDGLKYEGSISEVFNQITEDRRRLLYGRAVDDNKPDWRHFNWSEFFHMLPEFTGSDYRELFMTLRHELLIAQMIGEKTTYLVDEAFVEEHVNLAGLCSVLFERYNECKVFMQRQNQVAQKVSRNANLVFQYILLDELLSLLLVSVKKLFDSKKLNTLELIRRILVLAESVSVELRSILRSEDLERILLWDDNVSPQRVKDFSVAFHKHTTKLETFKSFDLRMLEQEELARTTTLTVLYGKNNFKKKRVVVAVPFPPELTPAFLSRSYDQYKVDSAKNMMFGFVFTVVISLGDEDSRQYIVKHITVSPNNRDVFDFDGVKTEANVVEQQMHTAVLKNIGDGFDICAREKNNADTQSKNVMTFFPCKFVREKPGKFNDHAHKHTEQAGIFWLSKKIDEVARQFIEKLRSEPTIPSDAKIGMISVDMISDKSSCDPCKLSMISMQASLGEHEFRAKFESKLREAGYPVPKTGLKISSRILSKQKYSFDTQVGNPSEKNVRNLKNLGIFQYSHSALFESGKRFIAPTSFKKT